MTGAEHSSSLPRGPDGGGEAIRITSVAEASLSNAAIRAFYAKHWARSIALSREDFAFWQFNKAPGADGRNHSMVALMGDEIIAVMGVTPAVFLFDGHERRGAELTTWVVAPEARGRGVGHDMLSALQTRFDLLTGSSISAAAVPLYLAAGFTFFAHIPRYFYISDFETLPRFAAASDSALRVSARRQAAAVPLEWCATPVSAAALAPEAGALFAFGHFARDAKRLAWRYDDHPAFCYEAFSVHGAGNSGTGAGVILRADRVENTPILHLIDVFGDPEDVPAALAFIEAEARNRGAAFVDISLTSGPVSALLRTRGWSSAVDDPLVELPSLFYPVELRRPATTSMAIWAREGGEHLYDMSRLHVTRGDMDLDRPTLAWYEAQT